MDRREGRGSAGLDSGSPSLRHEILSSEALFLTQEEDHADFLHPPGSPDPTWGYPSAQPALLSERVGTYGGHYPFLIHSFPPPQPSLSHSRQ